MRKIRSRNKSPIFAIFITDKIVLNNQNLKLVFTHIASSSKSRPLMRTACFKLNYSAFIFSLKFMLSPAFITVR